MKILKETKQPLLSRTEYEIEIEHLEKSTPKKDTLIDEISKFLKINPECLALKHVYTKSGFPISKIICNSYLDKESLIKIEKKQKKTSKNAKEEKKEQATK